MQTVLYPILTDAMHAKTAPMHLAMPLVMQLGHARHRNLMQVSDQLKATTLTANSMVYPSRDHV